MTTARLSGYVVSIDHVDRRLGSLHYSSTFAVEVYSPKNQLSKWLYLKNVDDNRELVFVSLLRDALVHSFPVTITYIEDELKILRVRLRSRFNFEEGKEETIEGKIQSISIDKLGLGPEEYGSTRDCDLPDFVYIELIHTLEGVNKLELMLLNLQSTDKETKMAQLSLLNQAYQNDLKVYLKYQNIKYWGDPQIGKTLKLITGVKLSKKQIAH